MPAKGEAVTRTPNTSVRAYNLISAAYLLPVEGRTSWLRDQCSNDSRLRQEISWMLEALRSPDDAFLEQSPTLAPEHVPDDLTVPAARDYRVIEPLGEGGMGTVYLAERTDGDYTQRVALKFLNAAAMYNPVVVTRFIEERRILAQLNHPNIAHLVDGGTLGDGRPFIAMEHVAGQRIDQHCDARALGVRERLQLFLKVLAGVEYAHQRLVIHRDIKPANILVNTDGEPKLLDFGIARLVDAQGDATRTEAGLRMMTLSYASPEQIAGDALTTATDVFSLGTLLYELLSGARPWRDDLTAPELARQIVESEPVPPSATARRTQVPRAIDADLDAIVLKCLRKAPRDRYGSARELADDLRNFLGSRPVAARRGHRLYRARKFVYRHRWLFATLALIVGMIAAFAWNLQMQLEETRAQRTRAELEREKAEKVSTVLARIFASGDVESAGARDPTVRQALSAGADYARRELADQPDVRAAVLLAIANTLQSLARDDEAVRLLDEIMPTLDPAVAGDRDTLVKALVLRAHIDRKVGRPDAALATARRAAALVGPVDARNASLAIASYRLLGGLLAEQRAPADEINQAFDVVTRAMAVGELTDIERVKTYTAIAYALSGRSLLREALVYRDRAFAAAASLPRDHTLRVKAAMDRAGALVTLQRRAEVRAFLRDEIEPDIAAGASFGSDMWVSIGVLHYGIGDFRAAAEAFERGVQAQMDSPNVEHWIRAASNAATARKENGDLARALAHLDAVIARIDSTTTSSLTAGQRSYYRDNALSERGDVLRRLKRHDESARDLEAAIAGLAGSNADDADIARMHLAALRADQGRRDEAVTLLRSVLSSRITRVGAAAPLVASVQIRLAEQLIALRASSEAVTLLETALQTLTAAGEQCEADAVETRRLLALAGSPRPAPACPAG